MADWRIVAAEQATKSAVILSGEIGVAPEILWRWDPSRDCALLPGDDRLFNAIDECKVVRGGKGILVNASYGGVAEIDVSTCRAVWYARASRGKDGPHSLAVLPDGCIAVANSTGCDAVEILDVRQSPLDPSKQILRRGASVPGAHGVVWNSRRGTLFVLGYTNLLEYAYSPETQTLRERASWRYDGVTGDPYGHDLVVDGAGGYFFTTHTGVWRFDLACGRIFPVRAERNVKSFSRDSEKGDLLSIPRERWWTDRLIIIGKDGARRIVGPFPGARFYKARWLSESFETKV